MQIYEFKYNYETIQILDEFGFVNKSNRLIYKWLRDNDSFESYPVYSGDIKIGNIAFVTLNNKVELVKCNNELIELLTSYDGK